MSGQSEGGLYLRLDRCVAVVGAEQAEMSQTDIRLDDLLARNIAIEWIEGVALVQTVCRVLDGPGSNGAGFPSPADILLRPDGDISVLRVATGENGAAAAARLLADMARDTLPTQLRLVLSQATSTQVGEGLAEFSKALGFFERPDSRQLLQQLYVRACLAPKVEGQARHPEKPALQNEAAPKPPALRRKKRHGQAAAVAAIAALACGAAVYVAFGPGTERPLAAVGALQAMVREQLGIPATNAAAEPVENPSSVKPRRDRGSARARASRAREGGRDALAWPISSRLRPEAWGGAPIVQFPSDVTALPVDATVEIFAQSASERGAFGSEGGTLYSATDPGVTPPLAIYPQLPSAPSPGAIRSDQTVVELIITPDGHVERATLRSVPRNVIEIMLLSAAKAWRFQPARRDGSPVRFLHRVVITADWNGTAP